MDRNLLSRLIVIVTVLAIAAIAGYPPRETINLGLDLQGGMHLVLQVETDDAVISEAEIEIEDFERRLEDDGITGITFERTGDTTYEATGIPADQSDIVSKLFKDQDSALMNGWTQRRSGDRYFFAMRDNRIRTLREQAVNQAQETIRNRIDAFGVAEPVVHREGLDGNRIVVQLPGVDDPERVKSLIKNTAFLEFRLTVDGAPATDTRQQLVDFFGGQVPPGVDILTEIVRDENKQATGQRYWAVEQDRVITGRDLKTAQISSGDFNEPVVLFILSNEGSEQFGRTTGENIGRGLAIILDNNLMSAPTIQDRITDRGIIRGDFTMQEVQDLVTVLKSGALPASLTYLEERTVGPSLGQDSIDKGRYAGLIGFLLVIVAMMVVYKLSGFNAVTALLLNVVLVFGALALLGATLTLPGIAGIVLTIGMAVDANVLVFERIREELRSGRTVKSAIAAGFQKALSSIFDANITTMIAAMFLFLFGTGPIRGFAVTLSVGIVSSIFTAVFVSRWMFDFLHARRRRVDKLSI